MMPKTHETNEDRGKLYTIGGNEVFPEMSKFCGNRGKVKNF